MVYILILSMYSGPQLNFEKLGFYSNASFSAFEAGNALFIASETDTIIVKTNADGKMLATYDKAGKGPLELFLPNLVGITSNELIVLNGRSSFLVLDHNLVPSSTRILPLPVPAGRGISTDGNHFVFLPIFAQEEKTLLELKREKDGSLTPMRHFLEVKNDRRNPFTHHSIKIDDNAAIVYLTYLSSIYELGERNYEVKVFDFHENAINFFTGTFEGLDVNKSKTIISHVAQTKSAYYVLIAKYGTDGKFSIYFLDTFNLTGKYLGRKKLANAASLLPVFNSNKVLLINTDDMKAKFLD